MILLRRLVAQAAETWPGILVEKLLNLSKQLTQTPEKLVWILELLLPKQNQRVKLTCALGLPQMHRLTRLQDQYPTLKHRRGFRALMTTSTTMDKKKNP